MHKLYKLVARNLKLTRQRPGAPREVMFDPATNFLTWKPPQRGVFTHYRIYVDRETDAPMFEVSSGQRVLQIASGENIFVTAYNSVMGLESTRIACVTKRPDSPSYGPPDDVTDFAIGTARPDGRFDPFPSWDKLNERMIFDWGCYLPKDVSNLGGVTVFYKRPGQTEWRQTTNSMEWIAPKPDSPHMDSFAVFGDEIPKEPEDWECICCVADKQGNWKMKPDGSPSGPKITIRTIAPNKGIGADSLNPGLIGGGLGMGSGKVFVKPGNGLLIDWSGAVVPNIQTGGGLGLNPLGQFYVPLGAISSANLASGTLSDLSKYTSDKRPIVVSYGTPALPHTDFPVGSVVMNTYDGKLYRNVNGQWRKDADPADLIAGTIAAGVVYSGRIAASQIDAGTITVGSGGLHFSGEGGIWVMNGGNIVVSPGRIVTQTGALFQNVLWGFEIKPAPYASIIRGLTMATQVKVGHYYIGDREVIDASAGADVSSLKINGTTVIDSSRNLINVTLERVNKLIVNGQHLSGDVSLIAGSGITLSAAGGQITISSSASLPSGYTGQIDWYDQYGAWHWLEFYNGICTSAY